MATTPLPKNTFKQALKDGRTQIGLWLNMPTLMTTELLANAGYDWFLLDGEHSPNDLQTLHAQLAATARGTTHPVSRPPWNDMVLIKRWLDLGVQSLLLPYVQTEAEAKQAVASTRYPPHGVRGVATSTRAGDYGRIDGYLHKAHTELCVLVQVETKLGYDNLDAITDVEGIDGVFIGPADFAAGLGHLGNPGHPDVRKAIDDCIVRIRKRGKAPGILAPVEADAKHFIELGCQFVAVGADNGILRAGADSLRDKFR